MEPTLLAAHGPALAALRWLPDRQREALVLRYCLDLSGPEIAASMGIGRGTVKSTTSPALAALGRLPEESRNPGHHGHADVSQPTDQLWTNASGSTLMVSTASTVGVLTGGQFTPLPGASNVGIMSAW
jgi:hypothetical protein